MIYNYVPSFLVRYAGGTGVYIPAPYIVPGVKKKRRRKITHPGIEEVLEVFPFLDLVLGHQVVEFNQHHGHQIRDLKHDRK